MGESRLVNAELDAGMKLDATEVSSVELIDGTDLDGAELASNMQLTGGSARRAQRCRVDAGGAELGGSAREAQWDG